MQTPASSFFSWTFRLLLISHCVCVASCATEPVAGGYRKVSVVDQSVLAVAQFAVEAQSDKMRNLAAHRHDTLELVKVIEAQEQVVAGMNYQLKLRIKENGSPKTVETVVWWQAWRTPNPYELISWK